MNRRHRRSALTVAGAACVACCAGPLWGVLAAAVGFGAALAGAVALFGATGMAVLALAGPALWRRRQRPTGGPATPEPVPVAAPVVRRPAPDGNG